MICTCGVFQYSNQRSESTTIKKKDQSDVFPEPDHHFSEKHPATHFHST